MEEPHLDRAARLNKIVIVFGIVMLYNRPISCSVNRWLSYGAGLARCLSWHLRVLQVSTAAKKRPAEQRARLGKARVISYVVPRLTYPVWWADDNG